jgi:hypothetical protein
VLRQRYFTRHVLPKTQQRCNWQVFTENAMALALAAALMASEADTVLTDEVADICSVCLSRT